ncbi:Carbamoyl-phosphate synthase pyrimidine-specific large chain [Caldibacillus thermoamylovorans]|uniref:Carbamoyl phosphate synthase large chain n=1 Tax=Caldibacillus thermoamylovorans TaxID=35841 RepID=A0A090IV19_9BACI|nr:carbamoyl-phosphate synthase (glutamine-hydrolyzing) large subunit [Caldibacillus thermoamylovorans]CEE00283.1 Carbamoyl-phosphate synthase pyrimidine-specific large chain [Caldibacillus thermoamylovorans]
MPLNKEIKKVLIIGSGPIVIGQAAEFDYAGTQGCLALKEEGVEVVLLNNNPATIMTDQKVADRIYIEPMTLDVLEEIIKKEQPDGVIGTLGGQTGLNLSVELAESKILEKYGVRLLGTPVESIQKGENREKFRELMIEIGEPIPESKIVHTIEDGLEFVQKIGFPVIIRPAYTLGGEGGGFANNEAELYTLLKKGLALSPIHQVLVERSIKGWKEIEYEVVRDANDTCVIICNMENIDPVGVHTGDSIVVAPSQTLSDEQYQILRNASVKVIRALGVIGGCNIQFAMDPNSNQYYIIEVNPRLSRSSALASKATGYPIARIAAKCALGYYLDEILNPVTGNTFASFEPALDYVVLKLPRFPFDKFKEANRTLGTQMQATGEVMAIDRSFEGALNKALRSLEYKVSGLFHPAVSAMTVEELSEAMGNANDLRLFVIAEAFRKGTGIEEIHQLTAIDPWFLYKIKYLVDYEKKLQSYTLETLPKSILLEAKKLNFSDKYLAMLLNCSEQKIREKRKAWGLIPSYKLVDTCAAEFDAVTPYYYSTWHGTDEVEVSNKKKALIIGSGPIRIGQGIEFDYTCVHAVMALKTLGYETIVVNNNPETVSTDYSISDKLYFEPITTEDLLHIIEKEQVEGVFVQFGGQTAINLAQELEQEGVHIFGTSIETIDLLEDRKQFYKLLDRVDIPHINGEITYSVDELKAAAEKLGYPVLVRPSYVIGGQSMEIIYQVEELDHYIKFLQYAEKRSWPLLVDKYLPGLECELDCISDGENVYIAGIFEHIERAGVHSGDSISIYPSIHLRAAQKEILVDYTNKICTEAGIVGVANIQFVIYENQIYCLEVNPRASRTVPILSKVTGIPIVEMGVRVQLGEKLGKTGLATEVPFHTVKAPVFSFAKLKNVDPIMGPEMKSTGEVLGIGQTHEEALRKAIGRTSDKKEGPVTIFCSVADRNKEELMNILRQVWDDNMQIYATEGTAKFLNEFGIAAKQVKKEFSGLEDVFKKVSFTAAIILPTKAGNHETVGKFLRELAMRYQVPLYTSLDTFQSIMELSHLHGDIHVRAINDYLYEIAY